MFGLHPDGTETPRRWTWSASPSPPLTSREFPDNRAPTRRSARPTHRGCRLSGAPRSDLSAFFLAFAAVVRRLVQAADDGTNFRTGGVRPGYSTGPGQVLA